MTTVNVLLEILPSPWIGVEALRVFKEHCARVCLRALFSCSLHMTMFLWTAELLFKSINNTPIVCEVAHCCGLCWLPLLGNIPAVSSIWLVSIYCLVRHSRTERVGHLGQALPFTGYQP